ncbi:hypothetical protein PBI_SCTP2_74 [Salicola phage SCTP-2]|nr:hypothetical protein PBI_SCTP2_74 [Salicola phage SCTP-2]
MITTSTIYSNTKRLNDQNGMLDIAMECAAFLEQIGAFAFKNWINGELIEGPKREKYFVSFKMMFPENMDPDPIVMERLDNIGCKVQMEQDIYRRVVNVKANSTNNTSFEKEGFEKRLFEHNVWVVSIKIPERFLPLDGNTVFKIDDEYIEYEDIEAVYVDSEQTNINGDEEDNEGGGLGDDEEFEF